MTKGARKKLLTQLAALPASARAEDTPAAGGDKDGAGHEPPRTALSSSPPADPAPAQDRESQGQGAAAAPKARVFCFNCGRAGHRGADCDDTRLESLQYAQLPHHGRPSS